MVFSNMDRIHFTKMHGIGNDYVYIDCMSSCPPNLEALARRMSDRHIGVGSDGIILILPSEIADFKMRIFNADGSEARMCGNGSRCVAKYVFDNHLTDKCNLTLETISGVKHLFLKPGKDGTIQEVTVDMGVPSLETNEIPVKCNKAQCIDEELTVNGKCLGITAVSMGNPHVVIFVDDLSTGDVTELGPVIENHEMFPERANVEFVKVISRDTINVRVWERGSGETLACGTGACASVVAAVTNGLTDRSVKVNLPGGQLNIEWNQENNHIYMTGPATTVFTGDYIVK